MIGVVTVLLWVFASLLLLVLLALSLPYHLSLKAETDPVWRVLAEVRPVAVGGPVVLRIDSRDFAERKPAAHRERRRRRKPGRKKGKGPSSDRITKAIRAVPGLIGQLIGAIRLDFLRVTGALGLGDPADTGRLFGFLFPLLYLPLGSRVRLDIRPDFEACSFSGMAAVGLRVVPIRLAWPLAVFGWRNFVVRR